MSVKQALLDHCFHILNEQVLSNEKAMTEVKTAIHNETKSSAGDKFETARATLQQEVDRLKGSIIKLKQQEQLLKQTPMNHCEVVSPGAVVTTNTSTYFISIGLGKINLKDKVYFAISPQAPIYQVMKGKREGDTFLYNAKQFQIAYIK